MSAPASAHRVHRRHERPQKDPATKGPAFPAPKPLSPVRYAGPDDLDDLLAFLAAVKNEIEGGRVAGDLIADLAHALTHRQRGVAFIIRGPSGIEASLGLWAERPLLSHGYFLKAAWLVAAPEVRDSGHTKSLLLEGRKFANAIGRPLLVEEMTTNLANGKAALIGRHLSQAGAVFLYKPAVAG